ncbi:MAG: hypothetical protein GWP67_02660 [Gammaproteobacteria bacterium]|jgi:hypothetical protein|nr:hypothetical protein [Gammaproteobacteria bacterium]
MSDELNGKPPSSFYIIGAVFLVWNVIGFMFYLQHAMMTPENVPEGVDAAMLEFMAATPVWATSAYAIAVNVGMLASVLLLMRKSVAMPLFVVSLAGALILDLDSFVLRDVVAIWGSGAYVVPCAVIIVGVIQIWYSRSVANRYYR